MDSSFSTYKLYKAGTSQVVKWLAKTAAQCGLELASETENTARKNVSNRKGKISSESPSEVTVPVRLLPLLATKISEGFQQLSDIRTLPGILEVLKDVIIKRKQWAQTFGLPDEGTLASNLKHRHFVTVLEDVYRILGGALSALQVDEVQTFLVAPTAEESTSTEVALCNLFAVLEIEEPTYEERTTSTPRRPSSSPPPSVTYDLEDHMDEEEVFFMISCFLNDFHAVRNHIRQSWVDYKSGKLDLAAVAVTTNVALEMLRRAEKALIESLPKEYNSASYIQVANILLIAVAHSRGVNPSLRHKREDVINMDLQDIADFTCLPVYIILGSFLPAVQANNVPVLKPGYFGKLNLTGQPLSWREKFNQDKIVLFEFLPEFCILNEVKMPIPGLDELSRGLMDMMRTKIIPLWLVLGCQIYLDVHHTMLKGIDRAHKELQTLGQHISKTLQDYLEFSKGMSIENWSQQNDQIVRMIRLEADLWVNQDYFGAIQKKLLKSNSSTIGPYSLLSRHPLLCGLMLFRLNLGLQEAGTVLVTAWGSLPSVMHLYNAVKQESSKDGFPLWEDVESVIRIQGIERVFMGDYPRNAEDYLKRFSLVMGYSASMFSRHRREGRQTPQTQTSASSRGPREMVVTSTMADVFKGQICGNQTRSDVTFCKIEKALATLSPQKRTRRGINGTSSLFSSVYFLASLQAQIQSEILALNIDYFALHRRCYTLLREIKVLLDPEFVRYIGYDYMEKESQLPFLVGHIFGIAAGSTKVAETLRMRTHIETVPLMKAGELVKELVEKEGNQEVERVRSVCRGYDYFTLRNLEAAPCG